MNRLKFAGFLRRWADAIDPPPVPERFPCRHPDQVETTPLLGRVRRYECVSCGAILRGDQGGNP